MTRRMACAGSGRAGPRAFTVGFDRDLQTGQRRDIRLIGRDQLYGIEGRLLTMGCGIRIHRNGTTLHRPARIPEAGALVQVSRWSSQSKAAVQKMMGAMPSQCPSAPFGSGEQAEFPGAGQPVEQCLSLAGRDRAGLVAGHVARAGDRRGRVLAGAAEQVTDVPADAGQAVGSHPGGRERPQGGDGEQRLEPGVCRRIVPVPAEVAQPFHDRAARFQLTGVHDHRGQAVLCGRCHTLRHAGGPAAGRPRGQHRPRSPPDLRTGPRRPDTRPPGPPPTRLARQPRA